MFLSKTKRDTRARFQWATETVFVRNRPSPSALPVRFNFSLGLVSVVKAFPPCEWKCAGRMKSLSPISALKLHL